MEGGGCFRREVLPGTLVRISGSCCTHPGFPHAVTGTVVGFGLPHAEMVQR